MHINTYVKKAKKVIRFGLQPDNVYFRDWKEAILIWKKKEMNNIHIFRIKYWFLARK